MMSYVRFRWVGVIVACLAGALVSCSQPSNAPAQVVERYLNALAVKDLPLLINLACPAWEAEARLEAAALDLVTVSITKAECQVVEREEARAQVDCSGSLKLDYGTEASEISLEPWHYQLVQVGQDWLVCGKTLRSLAQNLAATTPSATVSATATRPIIAPTLGPPSATPGLPPVGTTAAATLVMVEALTPTPSPTSQNGESPATPIASTVIVPAALLAEDWQSWPVVPAGVSERVQEIYQQGLLLGHNPGAFSILGDCQSLPEVFLGVYDLDPTAAASLPRELGETVRHFAGSFNRPSPTVKDGTTAGAVLWEDWHAGELGCQFGETPLDCELRLHRPAFVIIHLGTHYESNNLSFLRLIVVHLIDAGVVPILSTKADNRELDHRLNRQMADLAVEFELPLWNFWAAVEDLPEHGLSVMPGRELQGTVYLTEAAQARHRMTGLRVLSLVWRAVR